MFNDFCELTKDVLEGRKTMTRRLISSKELERIDEFQVEYYNATFDRLDGVDLVEAYFEHHPERLPYKVCDIVAVAQNYKDSGYESGRNIHNYRTGYDERADSLAGWTNKMFVKPDLMPHRIKILSYKIEHLQDISDDDCLAEGVVKNVNKVLSDAEQYLINYYPCKHLKDCASKVGWGRVYPTPQAAFSELIDKVSVKGTWKSNPIVLAYKFELIKWLNYE